MTETRSVNSHKAPKRAWFIAVLLLAFSAYALRQSLDGISASALLELAQGEITKRPAVFNKIHRTGDRQYLWALGPKVPGDESSEWFDMTGSPLELEAINHGLGRDVIRAIDRPLFAPADDPRVFELLGGGDRNRALRMPVLGVIHNGIAKAYPIALMNRHELVNDEFAGKPVTVAW